MSAATCCRQIRRLSRDCGGMWTHLPASSGVYLLTNRANAKVYVGSSGNIRKRCQRHTYDLDHGQHSNDHLQASWLFHGTTAFAWSVAELTAADRHLMTAREQHWIDHYHSASGLHGYNKAPAGRGPGRLGLTWSLAERQRISEGQRRFFDGGGTKNVAHGSSHIHAKLTEDDIRAIRAAYGPPRGRRYDRSGGVRLADLAVHYDVNVSVVSEIVNLKSWRHVV